MTQKFITFNQKLMLTVIVLSGLKYCSGFLNKYSNYFSPHRHRYESVAVTNNASIQYANHVSKLQFYKILTPFI